MGKVVLTLETRLLDLPITFWDVVLREAFAIPPPEFFGGRSYDTIVTLRDLVEASGLNQEKVFKRLREILKVSESLEINCHELKGILDDSTKAQKIILLDVRADWEQNICHIEGSRFMHQTDLPKLVEEANAGDLEIITICHHGRRSLSAALSLRESGARRVRSLAGGVDIWATQIDSLMDRY